MKKIKKVLALVLSIVLVLGAMPFAMMASAAPAAGDTYSVTIGEANHTAYQYSSDVNMGYGYRTDAMGASYYTFQPGYSQTGSVIYKFDDFGGVALKDLTVTFYGRTDASGSGQFVGCYVSTDGENWIYANAMANGGQYTKLDGETVTVTGKLDPKNGNPTVALSTLGIESAECLYVRMHVSNPVKQNITWAYYANLTVTGTYASAATEIPYNVNFGTNFGDDTTYVANDTVAPHIVEDNNMAYIGSCMLPPTKNVEGYTVFKFDAEEGYNFTDLSLRWKGRGISAANNRIDLYVSDNMTTWEHIGGAGANAEIYASQNVDATIDVSEYVTEPMNTLYVKVVMFCVQGSHAALYNLDIRGTQIPKVYTDYSVSMGTNFGDSNTYEPNANVAPYIVEDKDMAYINGFMLPPGATTSAYTIFKFAPDANQIFTEGTITWKGKTNNSANSQIKVYLSDSKDGEWILASSQISYNGQRENTIDLANYIGDGINELYVKIDILKVANSSNGAVVNFAIKAKQTTGKKDSNVNAYSITEGLGGDLYVGDSEAATVEVNPFWANITATSSNTDVLTATVSGNAITVNAVAKGSATLTVKIGDKTLEYAYNVLSSYLTEEFDEAIDVTIADQVDNTMFYDFASSGINTPIAKEAGAAVKLNVPFADFMHVGANYVKADVSWGATGEGVAAFNVYVDSIDEANKIATLYAMPYGSSFDVQTANSYLDKVITGDAHDIYVVFNTPGSVLHSIAFGNFAGDYTKAYTSDYENISVHNQLNANVINYSGVYVGNTNLLTSYNNKTATVVYRLDAGEGKEFTQADISTKLRNIKGSGSTLGEIIVSVSTNLKDWTVVKGNETADTDRKVISVSNVDDILGANTIYVKLTVARKCGDGTSSWHSVWNINISGTTVNTADILRGDTNSDNVVDIIDYIRFKKAALGETLETEISATAYYAGKKNLAINLVYVKKVFFEVDFVVDRSDFEVKYATSLPAADTMTATPTIFDALDLAPASEEVDAFDNLNASRINYAIQNYGFANLQAGETYFVSELITLSGDGQSLTSSDAENPATLIYTGGSAGDYWRMVQISGTNNVLKNVVLNQDGNYTTGLHMTLGVVMIDGATNATIENCDIMSASDPEGIDTDYNDGYLSSGAYVPNRSTGIYIISSTGARIKNCQIHNNFYGVLFANNLNADSDNEVTESEIYYNRADGVTFIGYGKVTNSEIYLNGYDCLNADAESQLPEAPIPGAGVYTEGNAKGLWIEGCNIYMNNGFNVDINGASNVTIKDNYIYAPGHIEFDAEGYEDIDYRNGVSMVLTGVTNSTITGNFIENEDVANVINQCYTHKAYGIGINNYFKANADDTAFSGLAAAGAADGNAIIACVIASGSENNIFDDNKYVAAGNEDIVGIGLVIAYNVGSNNTFTNEVFGDSDFGYIDNSGLYFAE